MPERKHCPDCGELMDPGKSHGNYQVCPDCGKWWEVEKKSSIPAVTKTKTILKSIAPKD